MVLVILALMGATSTVRMQRCAKDVFDDCDLSPEVRAVFDSYGPRLADCLDESGGERLRLRYWEEGCQARALAHLCELRPREMHELFTAFVASTLRSSSGVGATLGDTPLAAALAAILNVEHAGRRRIDEAHLRSCDREILVNLAITLGLHINEPKHVSIANLRQLATSDLRKAILAFVKAQPDRTSAVPPCFRFGTERELKDLAAEGATTEPD